MNRGNHEELRNRVHAALLAHGRPTYAREIARMAGFGARNGSNMRFLLRGLARTGLVKRIDLGGSVQWEAARANRSAVPVDRATWTRTVMRAAGPLLSHGAARLADLMGNYGNKDGTHIYASRSKLARDMGLTERQVSTYLDELRRVGAVACIKVEDSRNGLAAEYVLTEPTTVQLTEAQRRRDGVRESRQRGAARAREAIRRPPRGEVHQSTGGSPSEPSRGEVHQGHGVKSIRARGEVHQGHGVKSIRARGEVVQLTTRTGTPGPTTRTGTPGRDAQPTASATDSDLSGAEEVVKVDRGNRKVPARHTSAVGTSRSPDVPDEHIVRSVPSLVPVAAGAAPAARSAPTTDDLSSAAESTPEAPAASTSATSGHAGGATALQATYDRLLSAAEEAAVTPGEAAVFDAIRSATTDRDLRIAYTTNSPVLAAGTVLRELWSTKGRLLQAEVQRAEAERQADDANRRARGEHVHDDACRRDVAGDIGTMRKLQRVRDPGRAAIEYRRHQEMRRQNAQHLADHPDLAVELTKTLDHFQSLASEYDARYRDGH